MMKNRKLCLLPQCSHHRNKLLLQPGEGEGEDEGGTRGDHVGQHAGVYRSGEFVKL